MLSVGSDSSGTAFPWRVAYWVSTFSQLAM
jgi:hypothetical protein